VRLHFKDNSIFSLKFVDSPTRLAKLLHQLSQAAEANVQSADEYEVRQQEIQTQEANERKLKFDEALNRTGKCPRCGSENLQVVTETRTRGVSAASSTAGCCMFGPIGMLCGLPGTGTSSSSTKRMCLNCGKKF